MTNKYEQITRTVKSDELLKVFNNHSIVLTLCLNAKDRAISDKTGKYLEELNIKNIIGKRKTKRNDVINEYFDEIQKDLKDNAILSLVATFEKLVFYKIPTTIDSSKKILSSEYINHDPFSSSIKSFVKSTQDINNMSAIIGILSGSISVTLERKLKEIIDYRNRIAHGRRFGKESNLSVKETLERLDEVLESVI